MKKYSLLFLILLPIAIFGYGWINIYPESDWARDLCLTNDGGYILAGGWGSARIVKVDSLGDVVWVRDYMGMYADAIINTSDGGFAITGENLDSVFLLKTDSLGIQLWQKNYMRGVGEDIIETHDHGYLIPSSYAVIRTDSLGDTLWINNEMSRCNSAAQIDSLRYVVVGNPSGGFFWVIDDFGNVIRWKRLWEYYVGFLFSVCVDFDGGFVMAGDPDGLVMRTDSLGDSLWIYRLPDAASSASSFSVIQTPDSCFVFTGTTNREGYYPIYMIKLSPDGDSLWQKMYRIWGGEDNQGRAVFFREGQGFVVGGNFATYWDGVYTYGGVIIVADTLGFADIPENKYSTPQAFSLFAYPNPFNSAVKIAIEGVESGHDPSQQIEIFDINGRRVAQLPGGGTVGAWRRHARTGLPSSNPYDFVWQPDESLPSGVYLVRARADGNRSLSGAEASGDAAPTKRIVYLK